MTRSTFKTQITIEGVKYVRHEQNGTLVVADARSAAQYVKTVDRADGFFLEFTHPELYVKVAAESTAELNKILPMLGYKTIRLTSNLLGDRTRQFAIDADTPSYCDPGSEAYHSM